MYAYLRPHATTQDSKNDILLTMLLWKPGRNYIVSKLGYLQKCFTAEDAKK